MNGWATILLAFALMLETAAAAQRTGSLIKPAPAQLAATPQSEKERVRILMARYAECVFASSRSRLENYLEIFPGTAAAKKRLRALGDGDCLSDGTLFFSESLFRGQVYQLLYNRDFGTRAAPDISAVAAIDYAKGKPDDGRDIDVALRNFGDCVTRASPEQARALVLSNMASSDELTSFNALMPHFSGCLPQGATFEFSKSVLRGIVGETLYRLSKNAVPAGAAGSVN